MLKPLSVCSHPTGVAGEAYDQLPQEGLHRGGLRQHPGEPRPCALRCPNGHQVESAGRLGRLCVMELVLGEAGPSIQD